MTFDNSKLIKYGTLILTILNICFFSYSIDYLNEIYDKLKDKCSFYLDYNIYILFTFLISVFVLLSYLCCGRISSIVLFIINGVATYSVGIHRFSKINSLCDTKCRNNCSELVDLEDKINYFYGVDMIYIFILLILCFLNCICNFIN